VLKSGRAEACADESSVVGADRERRRSVVVVAEYIMLLWLLQDVNVGYDFRLLVFNL
jgi:hypothetical protein